MKKDCKWFKPYCQNSLLETMVLRRLLEGRHWYTKRVGMWIGKRDWVRSRKKKGGRFWGQKEYLSALFLMGNDHKENRPYNKKGQKNPSHHGKKEG